MITFKPFLGLANRMRAINSAVSLATQLNSKLKIVWVKDLKLNSWFTDLFYIPVETNIEIYQPKFSIYTLPFTYRFPKYMSLVKFLFKLKFDESIIINRIETEPPDLLKLNTDRNVFLAAFNEFYPAKFNKDLFKPVHNIMVEINRVSANFDDSTYGIHIRRTDNPISIKLSPTTLFENEIERIIKRNNKAKFYIASDSEIEKRRLIEKYGERIITFFFETRRQSLQGMQNAVVDLFSLSRTKMIIGSYWSSFSDIASAIGGIPIKVLKKE